MILPKLFTTLRTYSFQLFLSDLTAGIIVGIIALPLAIAFAIASGVSPEKGLITAVVAGFLISLLGGSKVQIGGPTGAFIVIVYGIVEKYGVDGLTIATILAGFLMVILGYLRVGGVIKFIPYPVIIGFTSGIAVVIFTSQVKDFLGLQMGALPADFIEKITSYFSHIDTVNYYSMAIAVFTVIVVFFLPRITSRIPGSLAAIVLATVTVHYFHLPVDTIGSRFSEIPSTLPMPSIPAIDFATLKELLQPAFAIAMLGSIESLLSAVVADGMIGGRHRSNMELIAQGIANIITPLFGGIPATGAMARTVANIRNGGRTPVAGIVHAITVLFIMLFFSQWAKMIPMACLAGILTVVAYNMSEWHSFVALLKSPRSDVFVLVNTFILTVVFDLTIAIQVGLVLSFFLIVRRLTMLSDIQVIRAEIEDELPEENSAGKLQVPEGVEIYEINGPFFFGIAHKFEEAVRDLDVGRQKPAARILRLRRVPFIDSTGLHHLEQLIHRSKRDGIQCILSGVNPQPMTTLKKSGLYARIGGQFIFNNINEALKAARHYAGSK